MASALKNVLVSAERRLSTSGIVQDAFKQGVNAAAKAVAEAANKAKPSKVIAADQAPSLPVFVRGVEGYAKPGEPMTHAIMGRLVHETNTNSDPATVKKITTEMYDEWFNNIETVDFLDKNYYSKINKGDVTPVAARDPYDNLKLPD